MTDTAQGKPFGRCPHCAERIELAPVVGAGPGRCASCNGLYLLVVPAEDPAVGDEPDAGEWMLLPHGSTARGAARGLRGRLEQDAGERMLLPHGSAAGGAARWLDARGLRKPLLRWAVVAVLGFAGLFAAGLCMLLFPYLGPLAKRTLGSVVAVLLLLIALPVLALPGGLVVRVLFGRRSAGEPRIFWSSVIAVTLGVAVLCVVTFARPAALARLLGMGWIGWTAALFTDVLLYLLAGWLAARLAPGAPYRHALGVGLAFALGLALAMLPITGWWAVAALVYLAYVPLLLLGAWLQVRWSPAAEPPGAPA